MMKLQQKLAHFAIKLFHKPKLVSNIHHNAQLIPKHVCYFFFFYI